MFFQKRKRLKLDDISLEDLVLTLNDEDVKIVIEMGLKK
jgi:hypothetical protein